MDSVPDIVRKCIEDAGNLTRSLGVGRSVGQVYALLYFSPKPLGLADLHEVLGISRGSASMTVRQLEQWRAVRKVWIRGDRKDYYEANDWIGQILRNVLRDTIGKRLTQANGLLAGSVDADIAGDDEASEFVRSRLENLQRFQSRVRQAWQNPVVQKLMGS